MTIIKFQQYFFDERQTFGQLIWQRFWNYRGLAETKPANTCEGEHMVDETALVRDDGNPMVYLSF